MTLLPDVPTSKMPTATVPFSYAQAAKGQKATSTSTPPTPLTPAIPGSPSAGPQDPPKNASANDAALPAVLSSEPRPDSFQSTQDTELNNITAAKAPSVSDASCTTQNDSAPSLGTSSGESRRDDDTSSEFSAQRSVKGGARPQGGPHRRSHHSRPASSGAENNKRNRRERKPKASTNGTADNTDKGSEAAESVKEAPPKPELFEAPIPTVNPWHQRRDAQLAKAQQSSDQTAKPTAANASTTAPQANARKGNSAQPTSTSSSSKLNSDSSTVNTNHQKRAADSDNSKKNGVHHKSEARRADPVPSDDVASWPTPDTATKEDKRKSTDKISVEKVEKPVVEDQGALKAKQVGKKDWVKMDFVPTVNFQTPLPQHKGTKPRGGARGGREGMTRGGSHAAAAATAAATNPVKDSNEKGSSPSASSTKANNGESRDTGRDAPAHPRGSSVPPMSAKRGSVDAPNAREQRKHSVPGANKSKDSSPNEHGRDKQETRGERTRGGPRSRGNYHGSTSQMNSQHGSFNAGYHPSNGAPRQNPYSPPIRQNQFTQSFGPGSSRGGGRGGRGGSGSSRGASNNNGPSRHPQGAVMNYGDHSFHGASVMGYPQTPSPAYFFDPFLVSALSAQLSWYFSIQNLCRDIYLRKNMDSQGFVPLSLVAGFNRVSSLLHGTPEPMHYVRQACIVSRDVELVVSADDGTERLRTVNDPAHWVLPMAERNEAAQNDGPTNYFYPGQQYPVHTNVVPGAGFQPNGPANAANAATPNQYGNYNDGQTDRFANNVNGGHGYVNGYAQGQGVGAVRDTVLKPTVPEFSPRTATGDSTFADAEKASTSDKSEEEVNAKPKDVANAVNGEVAVQESS